MIKDNTVALREIPVFSGDLLRSPVTVVCHQVNCQQVMGAGIAKQIHKEWPRVFEHYKLFCQQYRNHGKSPLGQCQLVWTDESKTRIVANLFGQEYYGRNRRQTDYRALRNALQLLASNKFLRENGYSLGFPYLIGCALGGGDWEIVSKMLSEELAGYPNPVEIWKL